MTAFSFDHVIFDMDGLMLDTETVTHRFMQSVAASHDLVLSDELFRSLIGRPWDVSKQLLIQAWGQFDIAGFERDILQAERQALLQSVPLKKGLTSLLDTLDACGIAFAVATSSGLQQTEFKLQQAGIHHRFEIVVTGDQVRNGKPAPDIYLEAVSRLNASPERCVVLEDSYAGIRSAHAAGTQPIFVPDMLPPIGEIVALSRSVCEDLDQVRVLLFP